MPQNSGKDYKARQVDVAQPVMAGGPGGGNQGGDFVVAHCLNAHPSRIDGESETFVTHSLRADGFDSGEDGTGRGTPLVAFNWQSGGDNRLSPMEELGHSVQRNQTQAVAFQSSQSGVREVDAHATLDSNNGSRRHNGIATSTAVRRLTPTECEALQGFPRGWTDVPYRGRPAADGPRYKALGNAFAVPVVRWIARRLTDEHARTDAQVAA